MLAKKLSMTLELCNGIIVFEAAAMLHDTDAEFVVIDSAFKTKKGKSTAVLYKKNTAVPLLGTGNGTKKYCGTLVRGTAHHCPLSSSKWSPCFLRYQQEPGDLADGNLSGHLMKHPPHLPSISPKLRRRSCNCDNANQLL